MTGSRTPRPSSRIWTAPIVLGFVITLGLLLALLRDGVWDTIASLLIGGAIVFAARKGFSRKGFSRKGFSRTR
jgi:hypothetical protein